MIIKILLSITERRRRRRRHGGIFQNKRRTHRCAKGNYFPIHYSTKLRQNPPTCLGIDAGRINPSVSTTDVATFAHNQSNRGDQQWLWLLIHYYFLPDAPSIAVGVAASKTISQTGSL